MVSLTGKKIIDETGKEDRFDSKMLERDLKAAGLADCIASLVAERVEEKVQDGWTTRQIYSETDLELGRLEEDIRRAHASYNLSDSKYGSSRRNESKLDENPPVQNRVELTSK